MLDVGELGQPRDAAEGAPDGRARALVLCTGNICRSPAAERMLRDRLGPDVLVASAGTHALVGQPIAGPMVALLESVGASAAAFVARQVTSQLLASADLVLTMTREQRTAAVELCPSVVRRSFTLLELARLLGAIDPGDLPVDGPVSQRLRAALPLAAGRRRQLDDPAGDDIADPYRRSEAHYVAAFRQIHEAADRVVRIINPIG